MSSYLVQRALENSTPKPTPPFALYPDRRLLTSHCDYCSRLLWYHLDKCFAFVPRTSSLSASPYTSPLPWLRPIVTRLDLNRSTGGPYWKREDNWDTDARLSNWHGVRVNDEDRVVDISLPNNNLHGKLGIQPKHCSDAFSKVFVAQKRSFHHDMARCRHGRCLQSIPRKRSRRSSTRGCIRCASTRHSYVVHTFIRVVPFFLNTRQLYTT